MTQRSIQPATCVWPLLILWLGASSAAQGEISFRAVAPDQWGKPDAELGLGGGIVENFEDAFLADGLTYEISDVDGNFSGTGAAGLPNTFNPVTGDPYGVSFITGAWDGTSVLINTVDNRSQDYGSQDWRPVAFYVPEGTAWIALASQQVTISHGLVVNGVGIGRIGALGYAVGPGRNGMMVISSDDPANPITSVSFGGRGDAFVIDHVVFAPPGSVPNESITWSGLKALYR